MAKEKNFKKAKGWAGIIVTLEDAGYLSIGLVMQFAENVARDTGLTWDEMVDVLNDAHKNVDLETSEAYVDVHWK